jgi:hypothetical protein
LKYHLELIYIDSNLGNVPEQNSLRMKIGTKKGGALLLPLSLNLIVVNYCFTTRTF